MPGILGFLRRKLRTAAINILYLFIYSHGAIYHRNMEVMQENILHVKGQHEADVHELNDNYLSYY